MSNSLQSKQFGFYGKDSYDIIIAQSLILNRLGKKVLMIDQSAEHELGYCINHCIELDARKEIITYHGIDFTYQNTYIPSNNYDYILINFGFNKSMLDNFDLEHIFLVSDMQDYNFDRIRQFRNKNNITIDVIVRNAIGINSEKDVKYYFDPNELMVENAFILFLNEKDIKLMYSINNTVWKGFNNISYEYKEMLKTIFLTRYDVNEKIYNKAYRKIKKGGTKC